VTAREEGFHQCRHRCALHLLFCCRAIADFPVKDQVGFFLTIVSQDRRICVLSLVRIHQHRKLFVIDLNQFSRIRSRVSILGHDKSDFLRLEKHFAGGQHHLLVVEQGRHPGQACFR
jgi:hypothetical protein